MYSPIKKPFWKTWNQAVETWEDATYTWEEDGYSSIPKVTPVTWAELTESWAEIVYTWGYGYYEDIPGTVGSEDEFLWIADYYPWLATSLPWQREGAGVSIYDDINKPVTPSTVNNLSGIINDLIGKVNDLGVQYQVNIYTDIAKTSTPIYTDI